MNERFENPFPQLEEATIAGLQAAIVAGQLTARQLTEMYIERIHALNRRGPNLKAVLEINPEALALADALDRERQSSGLRGPLHGIPLLIKDNIATDDQMQTNVIKLAYAFEQATKVRRPPRYRPTLL